MIIIVCGGRDYTNRQCVFDSLDCMHAQVGISKVVEGGATGADAFAKQWAVWRCIPFRTVRAEWKLYGDAAGSKRNTRMLVEEQPNGVVAFPRANGKIGHGTADMVQQAWKAGLEVWFPVPGSEMIKQGKLNV